MSLDTLVLLVIVASFFIFMGVEVLWPSHRHLPAIPRWRLIGFAGFALSLAVNVFAPLELAQLVLPRMPDGGAVVNVTSDAAVEAYEGWGGYGSAKAALEHWTAILAAEQPRLRVYAVDPGDMNTRMHQEAEPGEDLSHLPDPVARVPALLTLIDPAGGHPSGRYKAADLLGVPA